MQKYGFLGLGIMGSAIVANLINAGFTLNIWNRSAAKAAPLGALGGRLLPTPQAVIEESDVTFAMLADPHAAESVCFGKYGVLDGVSAGKGYVDMSTVDAATSRKIAAGVTSKGGRFLEAPVSGSRKPAEDGTLVVLAAGDKTLYDEAIPAFEKMAKEVMYLGEVGNGANMKLVINMIMGGMMTALSEGLALGEKAGLAVADILEVVDAGVMANPMFRLKGEGMAKGNFAAAFPLKHMQKDLRLAIALSDSVGLSLYSAAASNESFKKARGAGLGDEDFSAVYKVVKG